MAEQCHVIAIKEKRAVARLKDPWYTSEFSEVQSPSEKRVMRGGTSPKREVPPLNFPHPNTLSETPLTHSTFVCFRRYLGDETLSKPFNVFQAGKYDRNTTFC